MLKSLAKIKTSNKRLGFLGEWYPCLCVFVMIRRGMENALLKYLADCKKFEDDFEKYSLYVHGFFIPWLQLQREKGKLKQGRYFPISFLVIFFREEKDHWSLWTSLGLLRRVR